MFVAIVFYLPALSTNSKPLVHITYGVVVVVAVVVVVVMMMVVMVIIVCLVVSSFVVCLFVSTDRAIDYVKK